MAQTWGRACPQPPISGVPAGQAGSHKPRGSIQFKVTWLSGEETLSSSIDQGVHVPAMGRLRLSLFVLGRPAAELGVRPGS